MTDEQTTEETTEQTSTEETQSEETSTASPETGDDTTETPTTEESEQTEETVDTKSETESETETETTTETEETVDRVVPGVEDYTLPEGVPANVAQFAHDNDFTQEQLDATLGQFGSYIQGNEKAQKAVIRREGNELVESWGKQKKGNLSIVRRALEQNDPEGSLTKVLDTTGFGNHPEVLNFFLRVGNSMKEGGFLKGANNTPHKTGVSAALAMFGDNHPSSN